MVIEFVDNSSNRTIQVVRNVDCLPAVGERVWLRGTQFIDGKLVDAKDVKQYVIVRRDWDFDPTNYHREPAVTIRVSKRIK